MALLILISSGTITHGMWINIDSCGGIHLQVLMRVLLLLLLLTHRVKLILTIAISIPQ